MSGNDFNELLELKVRFEVVFDIKLSQISFLNPIINSFFPSLLLFLSLMSLDVSI